jgi:glycosyltransferase involved in cell wall biosynthesis
VVEALLRHWRDREREVVAVTTVELGPGMVDRFGELLELTPFAYHLPRLLPEVAWTNFLGDLLAGLPDPALLNVGSPWIYGALPELRSRFPGLRVVDQQFNDIGHLTANRAARQSIDITIAAYSELAETIRSDGRPASAVEVVPVGIPPLHPPDEYEVKALRQNLEIPDDHRVVAFVGRFSAEKRPEWALALAADLAEDGNVTVVLVGDGPLAEALRGGIGAVPGLVWRRAVEKIEPLLDLSDVVIIPSRIEGIPLVAMEALIAGVPVVATRVGGLPEIEHDPIVSLCDPDDYPGFVTVVREVLARPGSRRPWRPEAFSLGVMLERYDELLDFAGG